MTIPLYFLVSRKIIEDQEASFIRYVLFISLYVNVIELPNFSLLNGYNRT